MILNKKKIKIVIKEKKNFFSFLSFPLTILHLAAKAGVAGVLRMLVTNNVKFESGVVVRERRKSFYSLITFLIIFI